MTETQAIEIAREYAAAHNWPWEEPIKCGRRRVWFASPCWDVRSNADSRGRNVVIVVDEKSKSVSSGRFLLR